MQRESFPSELQEFYYLKRLNSTRLQYVCFLKFYLTSETLQFTVKKENVELEKGCLAEVLTQHL